MREIAKIAVTISLGGPFFMYWVTLTDLILQSADAGVWGAWLWWALFGAYLVYTVISIWFQVLFVPKVY